MSDPELEPGQITPPRTEPSVTGVAGALLAFVLTASSLGLAAIEDESDGIADRQSPIVDGVESPAPEGPSLTRLTVAEEDTDAPYDREEFNHWVDADRNGCDARQEVLSLESRVPPSLEPGKRCQVATGEWLSLYDAVVVTDPSRLDIDHMVPLKEAWQSTASTWTAEQREAYANDLDEPVALIAVTASSNRSKSDKDPAEWKPPDESTWCTYATAWITVKLKWSLTADEDEVAALAEMLEAC